MRITTNISKMDLILFNLAMVPKLRSTYVTILVIAVFALGFICWKNGIPQSPYNWMVALLSSLGGGLFSIMFGLTYSMIYILLMSSSKNGMLGEHEYTLLPEGLHEKTAANEGVSKWTGITKIKVVGPYLLFQISGYLFHIVPARSFGSKECFKEYVSSSMTHWQNAHNIRIN